MEREYVAAYPDLYRRHWWWRAREDFLMGVLTDELAVSRPIAILDVGCGAGLFFDRLRQLGEVCGVEPDTRMRTGRAEVDSLIHWGPLDSLQSRRRYDAILFLDVLEHLQEPALLLKSALPFLAEEGVIVATVPAFRALWTRHDDVNEHVERYTRRSFLRLADAAGLTTKSLRYFFHWLVPAKLLVRCSEALRSSASVPRVPRIPGHILNRTLYGLSRAEQSLGLDRLLPFGSSLLFVGTAQRRSGSKVAGSAAH